MISDAWELLETGCMKVLQRHALAVAGRIFRNGRLAHAWLLSGLEGTGKEQLARIMASLLICDEPLLHKVPPEPCGICPQCGKLSRATHPDLSVIKPRGAFIKLSQVHELQKDISYPPLEARNRVVLILHAHRMNRESSNALLKTLEEPPSRTYLILTAPGTGMLLPTIVSRCQVISCGGLEPEVIAEILCAEHGADPGDAEAAARIADGSITRALGYFRGGMAFRKLFFRFVSFDGPRRFSLFWDVAKAMAGNVDDFLAGLVVIRSAVRDIMLIKSAHGEGMEFLNPDYRQELERLANAADMETVSEYASLLETMERLCARNVNREMLANSLLRFWVTL